ncbi:protein PIN-LIKES 3-like isoform X3 [Durio zibethinus]|uniref:Protein PIN-LIKES 3-like isoform X3 n=1 Tax=Durio zibethinus TaxID=66656 RepID=A0A6P6B306_DURZI|nr:protein PIN-LIKES 3-like isoform X3 [Durio zibethinus]
MALLDLFVAASIPVLKVLMITALGLYLALDHVNILGEETRKHMNNVVFYVFNPALVASNLAETITYESMVKLWFMPFNVLLTFVIGSLLGWIVIQFTRPPLHLRGLILGCCAAGNMGNMLLIIIPAVCKEKGSPFGSPDACHSYGMGYVSLSMALGAIYLWSYVFNIVRIYSIGSINESFANDSSTGKYSREASTSEQGSCTEPLLSSKDLLISEENEKGYVLPRTSSKGKAEAIFSSKIKQQLSLLISKINLASLFAPSTTGVIVGFVIGLVPQIRKSMIGDGAPLRAIQDSVSLVGDGAIPTITLIVGGAARFGFVHADALYQFVLLLQFAVPPAMNIGTITQLFRAGESECSVIMFWTYALASISLTLWTTLFMWLVA